MSYKVTQKVDSLCFTAHILISSSTGKFRHEIENFIYLSWQL